MGQLFRLTGRWLGVVAALVCGWQLAVAEHGTPSTSVLQIQLDKAFGALHAPYDSAATAKAERDIWELWMHAGSAQQNKVLEDATAAMGAGNFGLSERLLSQLIRDNPRFAEAWNKRATLYYLVNHFGESLGDIEKTLEIEPRHFGALSGRGMILVELGKYGEALAAFEEAAAINPHMPAVNAAIAKLKQGDGSL